MLKYKDKVRIIKDGNGGFFDGTEGVVLTREEKKDTLASRLLNEGDIVYGVDIGHYRGLFYALEDELEKID